MSAPEGVFPVWKPINVRSSPFIQMIKKKLFKKYQKKIKIGHGGTLDELAQGILVIGLGHGTKKLADYQHGDKEYIVMGEFGKSTPSHDLGTELTEMDIEKIAEDDFVKSVMSFVKEFEQEPPQYSSKKVKGKIASERARKGENVKLKSKKIIIYSIEIISFDFPKFYIKVSCSGGTYMRSLVRDIGRILNVPAVMTGLVRTKVNGFDKAISIDKL